MSQTDRILRKINAKNDRRSAQPLEKWRTWVEEDLRMVGSLGEFGEAVSRTAQVELYEPQRRR